MKAERNSFASLSRAACGTAASLAALLAASGAAAQAWPAKPIRVMVGYAPGISVDLTARITAAEMSKRLGVAMIVENRPGANGSLALVATRDAARHVHRCGSRPRAARREGEAEEIAAAPIP